MGYSQLLHRISGSYGGSLSFIIIDGDGGGPLETSEPLGVSQLEELQVQLALEYMVSNYISRTIEAAYKRVSLRKLMLSVHAIRYDLEFLGVSEGRFSELVEKMIDWRQGWFDTRIGEDEVAAWLIQFNRELAVCLETQLEAKLLFIVRRLSLQPIQAHYTSTFRLPGRRSSGLDSAHSWVECFKSRRNS